MLLRKLKIYIEETGIKQKKIAEKLNVSEVHLSYVLNAHREISPDLEIKINQLIN
jgi:plasmid maintenance system antidote protein VapI